MLKTYRIIPLVFILFLFGFTLITVAPVLAQTTKALESRIDLLEKTLCQLHPGAHYLDKRKGVAYVLCEQDEPPLDTRHTAPPPPTVDTAPPLWNPSMGMRHPARPCMDRAKHPGGCGPDRRSPEQKASDPYDTQNPASQLALVEAPDCTRYKLKVAACIKGGGQWKKIGRFESCICEGHACDTTIGGEHSDVESMSRPKGCR